MPQGFEANWNLHLQAIEINTTRIAEEKLILENLWLKIVDEKDGEDIVSLRSDSDLNETITISSHLSWETQK